MSRYYLGIFLALLLSPSLAGSKAMFEITMNVSAPNTLANNQSASAIYTIKNHSHRTQTLVMKAIPGITQITTTTGACSVPIVLGGGQSCTLDLRINGSLIASQTAVGPIICQAIPNTSEPNPSLCYQPSQVESFFITQAPEADLSQNAWIAVLLAQNIPPTDLTTYVNQIYALAPLAEQIHPRVAPIKNPTAGAHSNPTYLTIYQNYANLIAILRTKYANVPGFQVGFHVDNSKGSEPSWGCADDDWQCVLNYSIIVLNNINELADPNKTGQGFNIFSIEQSYLEPVDPPSIQLVKACLNPPNAAVGVTCPVANIASPTVTYGDVLPSYGDSTIYGSDKFDYGYPQYYNLVERLSEAHGNILVTSSSDSYFPPDSAANCISGSYPYNVIDANLTGTSIPASDPIPPLIPCFTPNVGADPYPNPANDVFAYQNQADPVLAAAYDAYLMTQLPPISEQINTNGATVYITFSGEPQFLGSTGWTLAKINSFNQQLVSNFTTLNSLIPGIIPSGADTSAIKYAIWNYHTILSNNN